MTDSPPETSPLEYLAHAYFHQDWALDAPDAAGVIDSFVAENPREDVIATRESLEELLGRGLSDDEVAAEFDALDFNYRPELDGMTEREWLRFVADRISSRLSETE